MKIWTYKELRTINTDKLLDLLSKYLTLKEKKLGKDNIECDMNIKKVKNELLVRSKNNI